MLDDAIDNLDIDPDNAELTLQLTINAMIEYAFHSQNRYLPRAKERLRELDNFRPEAGALVRKFYRQSALVSRQTYFDEY